PAATEDAQRSDYQRQQLALTETLLDELFAADVLVIGAPMYNFTVPSQLKTWMDRVAQAGRTFKYTEQGPQGLLTGKRAYLVSGRGGIYSEGPAAGMDHQESLVKQFLAFIGITEVSTIRAEGVNLSPEQRQQSMQTAEQAVADEFSAA
ncbi:FMN-dependent NADH-azoreductase, partial [Idiomarina xiamenensis]